MENPVDQLPAQLASQLALRIDALFDEMIEQQQVKVTKTAALFLPHLTREDLLNPHDFTELRTDPIFNYEEGIASGLLAAQIALRARILNPLREGILLEEKKS